LASGSRAGSARQARVVLNGRSQTALDEAAVMLRSEGLAIEIAAFDASDPVAVAAGIEAIEGEVGPIDILINNAGMQFRSPLEEFPHEKWSELMRTNIDTAFFVGQAVARRMIPRGRGKIINIASVQSELARPGIAPYTLSISTTFGMDGHLMTTKSRSGFSIARS
jgi:gluconate 5-dehydrogenase